MPILKLITLLLTIIQEIIVRYQKSKKEKELLDEDSKAKDDPVKWFDDHFGKPNGVSSIPTDTGTKDKTFEASNSTSGKQ